MFSSSTAQVSGDANYIEDVFSSWLYTGNNTSQAIANGVDLLTKGGMVWTKARSSAVDNLLWDTARGVSAAIFSNKTNANAGYSPYGVSAFNNNGFTVSGDSGYDTNNLNVTFASWTFRKQRKFFDVVTYTGDGTFFQQVPHSLGSAPGCIIVKPISTTGNWGVWHRGDGTLDLANLSLNATTAAQQNGADYFNFHTSTYFSPRFVEDASFNSNNISGVQYVAYLFAHNAGGFGLTGADDVISCGRYTGNGSATGPVVSLGWEPQWLMIKNVGGTGNWNIIDNMRGMPVDSADATLQANLTNAESSTEYVSPTATGFQVTSTSTEVNTSASTYIYIAIRRGPMKVPLNAASVFSFLAVGNGAGTVNTTGFPVDMQISRKYATVDNFYVNDRNRGVSSTNTDGGSYTITNSTAIEASGGYTRYWDNTGFKTNSYFGLGVSTAYWNFRRAPGFFDMVCYTGTGSLPGVAHNLAATPELKIIKRRNAATDWVVGGSIVGEDGYLYLNTTEAFSPVPNYWTGGNDSPSVFSVRNGNGFSDASGGTYVAYLFASCPGVSKVGGYTGTGATQTINCGFTGGARFVMIKRTDTTGYDWYIWDTARGIIAGNDPYLLINTTAAQLGGTDYIDPNNAGFDISSTAPAAINASGGTYIFLAIA